MLTFPRQEFFKIEIETDFLSLISSFRSSLDQMNTCFIDLIQYHEELKEDCLIISKINNEIIKEFIFPNEDVHDELFHYRSTSIIFKYLNTDQTINLLNKMNKEIQNKLEEFLNDSSSPYNGLHLKKPRSIEKLKKKLDNLKKQIDDPKGEPDMHGFYMEEFSVIFGEDNLTDEEYRKKHTNDDDNDGDDIFFEVDRRYYGNPYHFIPLSAQKSLRKFFVYVNSLIILRIILNFDDNICQTCEKFGIPNVSVLCDANRKLKKEVESEKVKQQFEKKIKELEMQLKTQEDEYKLQLSNKNV